MEEPQTNPSAPQHEKQSDATEGQVITDYKPDVDCKQERSDPEIKEVNEVEENSDAKYAKMELPHGALHQRQ